MSVGNLGGGFNFNNNLGNRMGNMGMGGGQSGTPCILVSNFDEEVKYACFLPSLICIIAILSSLTGNIWKYGIKL